MKGWFKVPGVRPDGDRTVDEQMIGLELALARAPGKTVLDLGCAEGCISIAFAKAGARSVLGIEALATHLEVAEKLKAGLPWSERRVVRFSCANLKDVIATERASEEIWKYDIVLALGIIHKLPDPGDALRFAASATGELLCFRGPGREELKTWDGVVRAKHGRGSVNVPVMLKSMGFEMETAFDGVRGEGVQYWVRK